MVDVARMYLGWIFSKWGLIAIAIMLSGVFNGYREIAIDSQTTPEPIDLSKPGKYSDGLYVTVSVELSAEDDVFFKNPLTGDTATIYRSIQYKDVFVYKSGPRTTTSKGPIEVTGKFILFDSPGTTRIESHKLNLQSVYMENAIKIPRPAYLIQAGWVPEQQLWIIVISVGCALGLVYVAIKLIFCFMIVINKERREAYIRESIEFEREIEEQLERKRRKKPQGKDIIIEKFLEEGIVLEKAPDSESDADEDVASSDDETDRTTGLADEKARDQESEVGPEKESDVEPKPDHRVSAKPPSAIGLAAEAALAASPKAKRVLGLGTPDDEANSKLSETMGDNCEVVWFGGGPHKDDDGEVKSSETTQETGQSNAKDFLEAKLEEGEYDVVFANTVFHQLENDTDWHAAFSKAYRILAPGGSFWIFEEVSHEARGVRDLLRHSAEADEPSREDESKAFPRPVTFQLELLRKVGFDHVDLLHKDANFAVFGAVRGTEVKKPETEAVGERKESVEQKSED